MTDAISKAIALIVFLLMYFGLVICAGLFTYATVYFFGQGWSYFGP